MNNGKCYRSDCFAYHENSKNFRNNCQALDDEAMCKDFDTCTFYKKKADEALRKENGEAAQIRCNRKDCFAYTNEGKHSVRNNCMALANDKLYPDSGQCSFYKNKEEFKVNFEELF